jgi:hypothetical protein
MLPGWIYMLLTWIYWLLSWSYMLLSWDYELLSWIYMLWGGSYRLPRQKHEAGSRRSFFRPGEVFLEAERRIKNVMAEVWRSVRWLSERDFSWRGAVLDSMAHLRLVPSAIEPRVSTKATTQALTFTSALSLLHSSACAPFARRCRWLAFFLPRVKPEKVARLA